MATRKADDIFPGPFFDEEERELIESIETAWAENPPSAPDPAELERIRAFWREVAALTLRKRPVTVRLQERDLRRLRVLAQEKGLAYQTLIGSIIHQYVTGRLIEVDDRRSPAVPRAPQGRA
jgi:predicted DNA binding CopG/RHH family protein